jgi:hypothetical protein
MPFKIFSKIIESSVASTDSRRSREFDFIEDVTNRIQGSKLNIIETINRIIHVGKSGIVEDVNHLIHDGDVKVTIHNSYGYMQDGNWIIPIRG